MRPHEIPRKNSNPIANVLENVYIAIFHWKVKIRFKINNKYGSQKIMYKYCCRRAEVTHSKIVVETTTSATNQKIKTINTSCRNSEYFQHSSCVFKLSLSLSFMALIN